MADKIRRGFSAVASTSVDRVHEGFGSTDGSFGSLVPGASPIGTSALLVRAKKDAFEVTIEITNDSGIAYELKSLHFDFAARAATVSSIGPRDFTLIDIEGGLSPGNTVIAARRSLPLHIRGNKSPAEVGDYPDFDFPLDKVLSNVTLESGESARFSLVFSNETDTNVSSVLDNLAVVGKPVDGTNPSGQ